MLGLRLAQTDEKVQMRYVNEAGYNSVRTSIQNQRKIRLLLLYKPSCTLGYRLPQPILQHGARSSSSLTKGSLPRLLHPRYFVQQVHWLQTTRPPNLTALRTSQSMRLLASEADHHTTGRQSRIWRQWGLLVLRWKSKQTDPLTWLRLMLRTFKDGEMGECSRPLQCASCSPPLQK